MTPMSHATHVSTWLGADWQPSCHVLSPRPRRHLRRFPSSSSSSVSITKKTCCRRRRRLLSSSSSSQHTVGTCRATRPTRVFMSIKALPRHTHSSQDAIVVAAWFRPFSNCQGHLQGSIKASPRSYITNIDMVSNCSTILYPRSR